MRQRNDGHVNSILANYLPRKGEPPASFFHGKGNEGEGRRCNAQGRLIRIIPHFEERREEAKVTTPPTEREREGERVGQESLVGVRVCSDCLKK